MKSWKKTLLAAAVGTAFAGSALASPVFTVDPNALPSLNISPFAATFNADSISGTSSELLFLNPITNTAEGDGWVNFTSFNMTSVPVPVLTTGLGVDYGLYLTFHLKNTLQSGSLGAVGSTYALNTLDINVWYDPHNDSTFTAANAVSVTNATVTQNGADILLATSSLISGDAGLNDGQNGLVGAYLNSLQSFNLVSPDGTNFFIGPNPFYEFALTGFNNSGGGVAINGPWLAINNAVGVTDFYKVPEPGTMALLGIGLVGLGLGARRRKQ